MDQRQLRATLEERLGQWDWSLGLAKREIIDRLDDDDPLRGAVEQSLTEATYFSAQDVLSTLSDEQFDALAALWRSQQNGYLGVAGAEPTSADAEPAEAATGATAQVRQAVGQAAHVVSERAQAAGQRASSVAGQARDSVASVASGTAAQGSAVLTAVPERVKQTASQARDQVISIRTRDVSSAPAAPSGGARDILSLATGSLNRQPAKAMMIAIASLTIGAATGLIGWIARNVLHDDALAVRTERLGPLLIGFWSAIFTLNLADAWRQAQQAISPVGEQAASANVPATWSGFGSTGGRQTASEAADPTDEFPTVGL